MSAATIHLLSDAAVSLAVAAAGLAIVLTHGTVWLDPAVSLVVCVAIAAQAIRLLHRSADVLLESTPRAINPEEVLAAVRALPTVADVHDLHVWSLSSEIHAMSAHVAVSGHPTLEEAQATGERIKAVVASDSRSGTPRSRWNARPAPSPIRAPSRLSTRSGCRDNITDGVPAAQGDVFANTLDVGGRRLFVREAFDRARDRRPVVLTAAGDLPRHLGQLVGRHAAL